MTTARAFLDGEPFERLTVGRAVMNWRDPATLEAFHRGDRAHLEHVYRSHFDDVYRAVERVLRGADHENTVHAVFASLIEDRAMREGFTGGSMAAWLVTVSRNRAFDVLKRQGREVPTQEALDRPGASLEGQLLARDVLRRFRATLKPQWVPVFEACFVERLDQRAAAERLKIARTTIAYQWLRIKWQLERFVLEGGG